MGVEVWVAATPAGNLWRMLIAYALWAGAFNSKRSFSTTPEDAEEAKMQLDLTNEGIFLFTFYSLLCQFPK